MHEKTNKINFIPINNYPIIFVLFLDFKNVRKYPSKVILSEIKKLYSMYLKIDLFFIWVVWL